MTNIEAPKTEEFDCENQPHGVWRMGKDFIEAAGELTPAKKTPEDFISHDLISYYLIAHGIELQLKAFLISTGLHIDAIRKKFGHDIKKLLDVSGDENIDEYVSLCDNDKAIIDWLNDYYKNKCFEYFEIGMISLPSYYDICCVAEKISNELRYACIPKESHGSPGFISDEINITGQGKVA